MLLSAPLPTRPLLLRQRRIDIISDWVMHTSTCMRGGPGQTNKAAVTDLTPQRGWGTCHLPTVTFCVSDGTRETTSNSRRYDANDIQAHPELGIYFFFFSFLSNEGLPPALCAHRTGPPTCTETAHQSNATQHFPSCLCVPHHNPPPTLVLLSLWLEAG